MNLGNYSYSEFPQLCQFDDHGTACGLPSEWSARGCSDQTAVHLCDRHLQISVERIDTVVRLYQQLNKRVMVCESCYRPIFTLETHIDVKAIS